MGKRATKAADNVFCKARYEMAEQDERFGSREKASEILGIDRTRLANIELGKVTPYPDEVLTMSELYNCPEICNEYCSGSCAIGRKNIKLVRTANFDRLILEILSSTRDVNQLRTELIDIAADGVIDRNEAEDFSSIMNALERIAANVQALQLWAKKNIRMDE